MIHNSKKHNISLKYKKLAVKGKNRTEEARLQNESNINRSNLLEKKIKTRNPKLAKKICRKRSQLRIIAVKPGSSVMNSM